MSEPARPEELSSEQLVAYLDGQLSAEESERIEARLTSDPDAQRRLQDFDRVWGALDSLPRSTASGAFTQSTIEMAAQPQASIRSHGRFPRPPAWTLFLVGGAVAGWLLVVTVMAATERRRLAALPVAMHAETLEAVGTLDFLREFSSRGGDLIDELATDPLPDEAAAWGQIAAAGLSERREWVDELSPAEAARVAERVEGFQALQPAKRDALRELDAQLHADDAAPRLRLAAVALLRALESAPAEIRSFNGREGDETRLRDAIRAGRRRVLEDTLKMSDSEQAAFTSAMRGTFREQQALPRNRRQLGPLQEFWRERDPMRRLAFAATVEAGRWRGPRLPGRVSDLVSEAYAEWEPRLVEATPERVQRRFDAEENSRRRAEMMLMLLYANRPTRELYDVFAATTDPAELDRLLLMPVEDFRRQLAEGVDAPPMAGPERGLPPFGPGDGRRGPPGGRPPGPPPGRGR